MRKFSKTYIIGYGVMGKLLHARINKFYGGDVIVFDAGDELILENGTFDNPNHIIVATPISEIEPTLKKIAAINPEWTYISEIGSVKGDLCERYRDALKTCSGTIWMHSVHPMIGPLAKDWDIRYWKKPCLIVNEPHRTDKHHPIPGFWREMGFEVSYIDAKRHDEVIGRLSHLSHYMIMAYVDYVEKNLTTEELALAGTSFEKFKEMAEGAKRLNDIYKFNQELPGILNEFSNYLKDAK